jgi:hypothetical protein
MKAVETMYYTRHEKLHPFTDLKVTTYFARLRLSLFSGLAGRVGSRCP